MTPWCPRFELDFDMYAFSIRQMVAHGRQQRVDANLSLVVNWVCTECRPDNPPCSVISEDRPETCPKFDSLACFFWNMGFVDAPIPGKAE